MRRTPLISALGVWLGIIAMLAQLWLPLAHASAYAQRSGDPLGYAMCGMGGSTAASALRAQLRESLPPEVVQALERSNDATQLAQCQSCAALHIPALSTPPAPSWSLRAAQHEPIRSATPRSHAAHPALPPPARGPPVV